MRIDAQQMVNRVQDVIRRHGISGNIRGIAIGLTNHITTANTGTAFILSTTSCSLSGRSETGGSGAYDDDIEVTQLVVSRSRGLSRVNSVAMLTRFNQVSIR